MRFEILWLALASPGDYVGALKTRHLIFKEVINEGSDVYTFVFEPKEPCPWRSGQHAIFRFPRSLVKGQYWRPFTVASSPHENTVRIGTVVVDEPSDFKANLRKLKPGDTFTMNGPFGEFYITPRDKHIVGVAGGIGITPFRALLHDIAHGHTDCSITLIYSAKANAYTYKADLDRYMEMSDKIQIRYVSSREELAAELDTQIAKHNNDASYYLSGAPAMIDNVRKTLEERGIERIVNDPFKGY